MSRRGSVEKVREIEAGRLAVDVLSRPALQAGRIDTYSVPARGTFHQVEY